MKKLQTIDEYIKTFPVDVQQHLQKIRKTIHQLIPEATEAMAYGIPTFTLQGKNLVHFGGYKHHIGFYPTPSGMTEFSEELEPYFAGKGSAQFPLDKPIPYDLIKKIVQFRLHEVTA